MPPLCSEKRYPQIIGRRTRVSSSVTRPTILIGEKFGGGDDDDADESDENISPDADKSGIRFTLERRRDSDDNNGNGNGKGNNDGGGRGKDRSSDDDAQGRRNGRAGDERGGDPRFLHENDSKEDRSSDDDDGERGGKGGRGSNDDKGGEGGKDKGGNGKIDGDDDDKTDGNGDGNGRDRGRGGKNSGKDRGGSDSSSDDNSSTSPPPVSSSTTSTVSTVEASTTTPATISTPSVIPTPSVISTTSVVFTTSTPAPEITVSPTSQEIAIPFLTPLPAVENPITDNPALPTTSLADNGLNPPQASTSIFLSDIAGSSVPAPTQTNVANDHGSANDHRGRNGNNNNNNSNGNNNNNKDHGSRLSATSERILVAAGSIGAFIVLCFIVWAIYRMIKKSKQSSRADNSNSWLTRLVPWHGNPKASHPQSPNGSNDPNEPLPAYDAGNNNSMEAFGYYDQRKLYPQETERMVAYPPAVALQNGMAIRQNADGQMLPPINALNLYPQPNTQMVNDDDNADSTLRSRMPDPYYNQSEFARQPSDAYNPAQRQVYRASEISSLSSGFGDGDIIMPPPNVVVPKTPTEAPAMPNADTAATFRPFSWMSRSGTEQQRDTVYTTASDRRTRFRSVNSWVDQQKRRMKRAG